MSLRVAWLLRLHELGPSNDKESRLLLALLHYATDDLDVAATVVPHIRQDLSWSERKFTISLGFLEDHCYVELHEDRISLLPHKTLFETNGFGSSHQKPQS